MAPPGGAVSGSIPARAGGTRLRKEIAVSRRGSIPRAGGGNHHEKCLKRLRKERSIPARAGGTNGWIAKGT